MQTGDSSADATELYRNRDLLGHIYVGPYLAGNPRHAFVVADREGVAGYSFAVEDTRAFEKWQELHWWPELRKQYPSHPVSGDELTENDEELIRMIHQPKIAPPDIVDEYPAHLHIDLLPRVHGQGFGRKLMDLIVDRLRENKVSGVHFGVSPENPNALAFYKHLGFSILREDPDDVYMGKRLS